MRLLQVIDRRGWTGIREIEKMCAHTDDRGRVDANVPIALYYL